jgi:hypothetical protein
MSTDEELLEPIPFEPMDELEAGTCASCRIMVAAGHYWCSGWCRYKWKRWKERQEAKEAQ